MNIIEHAVRLFAPHTCLGCGVEDDRLVCLQCVQEVVPVPSRCYRCKAVTEAYTVCRDCQRYTPLRTVLVYTYHKNIAKELLHHMKYERAQAGIAEAATLMSSLMHYVPVDSVLVHIPTATSRVRQRGYDHTRLLTKNLARPSNVSAATLLGRVGQAHQVGAGRTARLRQLENAFRPVNSELIRGKHVVLVDDVLTTGATLETAARVLRQAGAREVSAIVFAQA